MPRGSACCGAPSPPPDAAILFNEEFIVKQRNAWTVMACVVAALLFSGCKEQAASDSGTSADRRPRDVGTFDSGGTAATTQPAGTTSTPPTGTMPNDAIHSGLGQMMDTIELTAPAEWQARPKRPMTEQVFALPKAEGDPEDGDVAVSNLAQHMPLDSNVLRWCGQFGLDEAACKEKAKRTKLEGTKFPTTLVDISGTYKGGSMMAPAGPPKENFRMLAAEIRTPRKPWFIKLVGPEKTVARWEDAFTRYVREAK